MINFKKFQTTYLLIGTETKVKAGEYYIVEKENRLRVNWPREVMDRNFCKQIKKSTHIIYGPPVGSKYLSKNLNYF